MKNKLRIPVSLMMITIVVIACFQLYWLRNNFRDEENLFHVRTNILFRETIFKLQASKLHLDSNIHIRVQDKQGIIRMTNVLQEQIRDSALPKRKMQSAMFITVNKSGTLAQHDSNLHYRYRKEDPGNPVFDFLVGVDSLHDSLTVREVTEHYRKALAKEQIALPFSVTLADTSGGRQHQLQDVDDNKVMVGFVKPRIFRLDFVDNRFYLIRRMWQPILISVVLVGFTIASFFVFYRNLVRQQRLTQIKNDFISNITHELKTPIATVSVAIEALNNFNALHDPQRTKEYLDISALEMKRLGLMVDNVLKFSLYENREISLEKEPVNLLTLVDEVLESMKLQFDSQRAIVKVHSSGNNFVIDADKLHMTSVLYNLLDNALKYSSENPQINIDIIDHTRFAELKVTDNGIGIPNEYRHKVFERFFRVPGGDRHDIKGYGLGLSYVNHIVQRHQGFIEVTSKLGEGSSFSVRLPFKEAPVIHYDKGRKVIRTALKLGKS